MNDTEVIFVSESKRGIKKKYFEIIKFFGIKNFISCVFYEIFYLFVFYRRKNLLNSFYVSDANLNKFLESQIKKNKYKKIISIGCPCLIKPRFNNYEFPIYNIHGGIIPFQKGRYSPLKALKKGEIYLGSTIHEINDNFDDGTILSQDFFEIRNNDKLKNYNMVLRKSSELMKKFIDEKYIRLPNEISLYFEKRYL
tara:strand:- start:306 stop:893 length:588 start_codon:yes stop_codon:yes gene_type:complete